TPSRNRRKATTTTSSSSATRRGAEPRRWRAAASMRRAKRSHSAPAARGSSAWRRSSQVVTDADDTGGPRGWDVRRSYALPSACQPARGWFARRSPRTRVGCGPTLRLGCAPITQDQGRLRANLRELPSTAKAHKRYLEKFDQQESQIEKYQADIKKLQATEHEQQKDLEDFLAGFSAE